MILGLGSNVALVANPGEETEGKIANLEQAITGLCSIPDTQIIDISSYYESEPAYYEDQDTFVNAVVLARTGVPPKELLKYLHAIENSLGRTREIENGLARSIWTSSIIRCTWGKLTSLRCLTRACASAISW